MKKILFLMAIFATMIFTNCEKENDPKVLSEFVIGTWVNDDLTEDFGEGVLLYATFLTTGKYVLELTDGTETYTFPEANYTVDNEENLLTIEEPEFESNLKSLSLVLGDEEDQNTFKVEWNEAVNNTMIWKDLEEDDFWLEWERVNK